MMMINERRVVRGELTVNNLEEYHANLGNGECVMLVLGPFVILKGTDGQNGI